MSFSHNSMKFFGNGESFLFELAPRMINWEWVGKKKKGKTEVNEELFQYVDDEKLIVGGGANFGLLIDNELAYGRTKTCDTFANDILGTEKEFKILLLEVFTFCSS